MSKFDVVSGAHREGWRLRRPEMSFNDEYVFISTDSYGSGGAIPEDDFKIRIPADKIAGLIELLYETGRITQKDDRLIDRLLGVVENYSKK